MTKLQHMIRDFVMEFLQAFLMTFTCLPLEIPRLRPKGKGEWTRCVDVYSLLLYYNTY